MFYTARDVTIRDMITSLPQTIEGSSRPATDNKVSSNQPQTIGCRSPVPHNRGLAVQYPTRICNRPKTSNRRLH